MNPPTLLTLALREGWYALLFVMAIGAVMAWLLENTGASDANWLTSLAVLALFEVEVMPANFRRSIA